VKKISQKAVFGSILLCGAFMHLSCVEPTAPPNLLNPADPSSPAYVPPAPNQLSLTQVDDHSVDVRWVNSTKNGREIRIERRWSGQAYVIVGRVPAGSSTFRDTTELTVNLPYTYRVGVVANSGAAVYAAGGEIALAYPPPDSLVVIQNGESSTLLSWKNFVTYGSALRVERRVEGSAFVTIATLPMGTRGYVDTTDLVLNTSYVYRIGAVVASGAVLFSRETPITVRLAPPYSFTLTQVTDRGVQLAWTNAVPYGGSLRIERRTQGGSYVLIATLPIVSAQYLDTAGIALNTSYTYRIGAVSTGGVITYSTEAGLTVFYPAPYELVAAQVNDNAVRLTWTNAVTYGQELRIERRSTGSSYSMLATVPIGTNRFVDSAGIALNTTYIYRLGAVSRSGVVTYGNELTFLAHFASPFALSITDSLAKGLVLHWMDTSDFATGYSIEEQSGTGGFSQVAFVPKGRMTAYLNRPDTTTTRGYRVIGFTTNHQSPPSADIQARYQAWVDPPTLLSSATDISEMRGMSRDGSLYATKSPTSDHNAIRIYATSSGRPIHTEYISYMRLGRLILDVAFAFMPDNSGFVMGGDDDSLRVYSLPGGERIKVLGGYYSHVTFSRSGTLFAGLQNDGKVTIWDPISWKVLRTLTGASNTIEFTPDDNGIVTLDAASHTLVVLDAVSGGRRLTLWNTWGTESLIFNAEGTILVTQQESFVAAYKYPSCEYIAGYAGSTWYPVVLNHAGTLFAGFDHDQAGLNVWDAHNFVPLLSIGAWSLPYGPLGYGLQFHPNNTTLLYDNLNSVYEMGIRWRWMSISN